VVSEPGFRACVCLCVCVCTGLSEQALLSLHISNASHLRPCAHVDVGARSAYSQDVSVYREVDVVVGAWPQIDAPSTQVVRGVREGGL
jgi:hypothetical protein